MLIFVVLAGVLASGGWSHQGVRTEELLAFTPEPRLPTDFCFAREGDLVYCALDTHTYPTIDGLPISQIAIRRAPDFELGEHPFFRDIVLLRISASLDGHWLATSAIKNRPELPACEIQIWKSGQLDHPHLRVPVEPSEVKFHAEFDSTGKRPLWSPMRLLSFTSHGDKLYAYSPGMCEIDLRGVWSPYTRWRAGRGQKNWTCDAAAGRVVVAEKTVARVYDLSMEREVQAFSHDYRDPPFTEPIIKYVAIANNERFVYSRAGQPFEGFLSDIQVWDTRDERVLFRECVRADSPWPVGDWLGDGAVRDDGKLIAVVVNTSEFDNKRQHTNPSVREIRFYDTELKKPVGAVAAEGREVLKIRFSPCGKYLAILVGSGKIDFANERHRTREFVQHAARHSRIIVYRVIY